MTAIRTTHERRVERARALRRNLLSDRLLVFVTVGAVAWLVAFAVATLVTGSSSLAGKLVGDVVFLIPEAPLPVLAFLAARHRRARVRSFWLLLSGFAALWLTADTIWGVLDLASDSPPDVSIADAFYVGSYAFALAAILVGVRISWSRLMRSLLDAAVIAVALAAGGWHVLIRPIVEGADSGWAMAPSLSYPVLDIVTVFLLLTVIMAADTVIEPSVALIAGSFVVVSVVDALYTYFVTINDRNDVGTLLNIGWEVQTLLFGLACVVALRHQPDETPRLTEARDVGIVPLLLGVVGVVVMAGFEIRTGDTLDAVLLGSFGLAALVARLLLTAHTKGKLARELEQALSEQERLAISDALTGLHNRRFFDQAFELEVARSERSESSLGLLLLDLDHFKWINDRYGHQTGDDVLVEVARRLEPVVRGGDLLARYGGEEFVVLLPDTAPARLREVADRCRRAVGSRPFVTQAGLQLSVTVSVGGANQPEHATGMDDLVHVADKALYRAKALGRDQVQVGLEHELELEVHSSSAHEFLQRLGDEIDRAQGRSELSRAISRWAELVAREMGLDTDAQRRCSVAARFHDIGKIAVPASILRKRDQLTPQEWELVREHPQHGERLISLVPEFRDVAALIRDHHERPDGTGYPSGKSGRGISLEASIISVCDAWAAMRTPRAYRPAHSREFARGELIRCRGTQFQPAVVDAFLAIEAQLRDSVAEDLLQALALENLEQT
jgi:two-component system, cell cycle response regulator